MRATPDRGALPPCGLALLLLLAAVPVAAGEAPAPSWKTVDWPQWRGPQRDGVSTETGLAAGWPAGGPPELWRRPLGEGFSAISVVDGVLYTQYATADGSFLVALAAADGRTLWKLRSGERFTDSYGNGPRATPTVAGDTVFALDSRGVLLAADRRSGKQRWRHDLRAEYGARPPRWGLSGSPLVEGGRVIVQAGGEAGKSILAFAAEDGQLIWSARDEKPGYAAPLAFTAAGRRQLLVFSRDGLVALDPVDGSTLWDWTWKTDWGVNASTPVLVGKNRLFLSTGYQKGAALLQLVDRDGGVTVEEVWRNREMRNKFSSSLLYNGKIYGFDEGTLKCLDPDRGQTLWAQRGLGHGSLLAVDGKLIVLSDRGRLVLLQATPEGYAELASAQPFETKTWTVPTLAGGRLYLRNETEIVALDVSR